MRTVIICNITSLDGYYEGPGNNVMALPMDPAFDAYNLERIRVAGTVLLGSTSYGGFSSYWPGISDARRRTPTTGRSARTTASSRASTRAPEGGCLRHTCAGRGQPWRDQTAVVPQQEAGDWVATARESGDGDILVFGSRQMWNGLLSQGLVELHVTVGAVVLGGGAPLFIAPVDRLALLEARTFDGSDNVVLVYAARS
jgi:dihydrofolate reductase